MGPRRHRLSLVTLALIAAACSPSGTIGTAPALVTTTSPTQVEPGGTARVLLVGDIMLGRGVAPIAANDPDSVFENVRFVISSADIAAGNLESPLTELAHDSDNPNALEANPATAQLLERAGFDLMSIANNHAGDAGPASVLDTITAVQGTGMSIAGGGRDAIEAAAPVFLTANGVRIGFLAVDATACGLEATEYRPGIARYEPEISAAAVAKARADADVVIVSVHGGIEYNPEPDPTMRRIADHLVAAGADVVWGHGAHISQPVRLSADGEAIIATNLGNFLFDQNRASTERGTVLELLVDRAGVIAHRTGKTDHSTGRVRFDGWDLPSHEAVLLDEEWWNVDIRTQPFVPAAPLGLGTRFDAGRIIDASAGDVTENGEIDVVISSRQAFRSNPVNDRFPDHPWVDANGDSAHIGVYDPVDLREIWVAGSLFRPVATVAACDGTLALAFDELDDPAIVATSAWTWRSFGFIVPAELPGSGTPGCADVDHDGTLDPVIVDR